MNINNMQKNLGRRNSVVISVKTSGLRGRGSIDSSQGLARQHTIKSKVQKTEQKTPTYVKGRNEESDDSIDSNDCTNYNERLKGQILKSMDFLKNANQEYIDKNHQFEEKVSDFHDKFKIVNQEITEIHLESSKSKTDVANLKKAYSDSVVKVEIGKNKDPNDTVGGKSRMEKILIKNKINMLKMEMDKLKKVVDSNEESLLNIEIENTELKNITNSLRGSMSFDRIVLDDQGVNSSCQSCIVV